MVTSRMAWVAGLWFLVACSGKSAPSEPGPTTPSSGTGTGTGTLPPDTVDPGGTGPQYPGNGFRVHEWGTNTVVVGSDGSLQRGLHHEEEDLPSFVYDRRKKEQVGQVADVKMETPVTYFYSDKPMTATVSVAFPKGVLSQWYPAVQSFYPPVLADKGDPALDKSFPYTNASCRDLFAQVVDGNLSWGEVEILGRGVAPILLDAPLDRFTWSHARNVDANALSLVTGKDLQQERFLFYRGLGNFPLGVNVTSQREGGVILTNTDAKENVGAVFVLRVKDDKAAFVVEPAGIAPGKSLGKTAPEATQPLDPYANDLAKAMVAELDKAGLYHDESIAMVKTWARQWFRTPGVRVLYLAPQAWTDAQIPLTVEPAPIETKRVMVIRVEAITPEQEDDDQKIMPMFDGDADAQGVVKRYFQGFGRFAEPRLRRALAMSPTKSPNAQSFVEAIAGANVGMRTGE
jgi:hypothetical protein